MQVQLRKKKLQDGRESLYLDIYKDGKRSYDFLGLYIKRGDPNNKEILLLAEKIKSKKMIELANDEYDQISSNKKRASFTKYYEKFTKTKHKWSNYYGALKYLRLYEPKDILFKQINKAWLNNYAEYLSKESGLKKNTSFLYFRKIKEVLYKASNEGFIKAEIVRQATNLQRERVERGYLELKEIQKLVTTASDRPEITKAFLFSCFTGLRQCDVRNLKWKNISDGSIKIQQQKTKASLIIPLSETALNILKIDNVFHLPETKIFNLPTDRTTINRALSRWFKNAGIDKKAFYHLSRHTFATLNLTSGNEIYTVSKLLGHKSLKTTEIYAKIIDEKKKQAMDNLPVINVGI
ncbi:MAG: site-specific integrase [Ignavibacteriaceae bacterium]